MSAKGKGGSRRLRGAIGDSVGGDEGLSSDLVGVDAAMREFAKKYPRRRFTPARNNLRVFKFSWKEVAPHLPPKVVIIVATDAHDALVLLSARVSRASQHFRLNADRYVLTPYGRDHHFTVEQFPLRQGVIIHDNT